MGYYLALVMLMDMYLSFNRITEVKNESEISAVSS